MKRYLIGAFVALAMACVGALGACMHNVKNPQQAVLEARVEYTIAVEAASTYGDARYIPICSATTTVVCAKPAIVHQIKVAKDSAKAVIDGAQATVLDPNFDRSTGDAIVLSAQSALKALTTITRALDLKAPPKPTP